MGGFFMLLGVVSILAFIAINIVTIVSAGSVYDGRYQALLVKIVYGLKYRLSGPKGKINAAIFVLNYRIMMLKQVFGKDRDNKIQEVIAVLKSKRNGLRARLKEIMQLDALSGFSVFSGHQEYDYLFPNSLEHMINDRIEEIKGEFDER